jgi:hypothetical protein
MQKSKLAILIVAFIFALSFSINVSGQEPPPENIYLSTPGAVPSTPRDAQPRLLDSAAAANDDEPGKACTTYDFEGIGNLAAVPEFSGITSPNWLGIIDADNGGNGNIAHEPSPSTVAFWLGTPSNYRDILFDVPVSDVSFFYASAVTVTIQAFDANNQQVASVSGAGNYNQGPGGDPNGGYNKWDPLRVQTQKNEITRARVSGNVDNTAIDDLKICRSTLIDSVEFVQVVQQLQPLTELENGTPPTVPIVANKLTAMRIYMAEVKSEVELDIAVSGAVSDSRRFKLQPGCTPKESRERDKCQSIDFYFIAPQGTWTVTVAVIPPNSNTPETHDFTITSVNTRVLLIVPIKVCDAKDSNDEWQCADRDDIEARLPLLSRLYPGRVMLLHSDYQIPRETTTADIRWWGDVMGVINRQWEQDQSPAAQYYFGAVRAAAGTGSGVGGGGWITTRPEQRWHVAASRIRIEGSSYSAATVEKFLAHEIGHNLGRYHIRDYGSPGCAVPTDYLDDDWGFNDPFIHELGFEITGEGQATVHLPDQVEDIMSYCSTPNWVSIHTYTGILDHVTIGASPSPAQALVEGQFWIVSGTIENGAAAFDPLLTTTSGNTASGTGTYRLEIRNAGGGVLFTRNFEPALFSSNLWSFLETIPIYDDAASIVLMGPGEVNLGTINMVGAAPTVNITFPTGGEVLSGLHTVTWTAADSDSNSLTYKVEYSADNGASWSMLTLDLAGSELDVDFDELPGSVNQSLLRVTAYDGAHSGSDNSNAFSVSSKPPTAEILAPNTDAIFSANDLVWLQASAFDSDDGEIPASKMLWISSRDGFLGLGDDLPLTTLSDGAHTITFSARDSDGNIAYDSVNIVVDGAAPNLSLYVILDGTPASCADVTIHATDQGAGLDSVEYSLNGGDTWTNVPLNSLPYNFVVPGAGFFHIIARTFDKAGNFDTADQPFFTQTGCLTFNATPTLTAPANGFVTSSPQPAFSWNTVPGAVRYRVKLGSNNPPLVFVFDGSTTAYIPPGPLQTQTYYWQVQAINSAGRISNWSEARSFTIQSPGRVAPSLNLSVTSTPTLTWNRISWAAGYHIQVDNNANFSSLEFEDDTLLATDLSVTTDALTLGNYYWRARAKRMDGRWGTWSRPQVLVIGIP